MFCFCFVLRSWVAQHVVSRMLDPAADWFVLLACDGGERSVFSLFFLCAANRLPVFDVLSHAEAAREAAAALLRAETAQEAARAVVQLALKRGSTDNVSCTVLLLRE